MADRLVHRLVHTDWEGACSTSLFCFQCASPVCSHCCADHRNTHHGQGPSPARISTISFAPAIRSQDAIGCGYSLTGIQRIKLNGVLWIPILPPPVVDSRYQGQCLQCLRRIRTDPSYARFLADYCGCTPEQDEVWFKAWWNFQSLLDSRSISWISSVGNLLSEPSGPPAPPGNHVAGPDLITIERLNGWLVIEQEQLPVEFGQDVQVMVGEDGRHMLPIKRLLAEHGDGQDGPVEPDWNLCARPGCNEMFNGDAICCCLRCLHLL